MIMLRHRHQKSCNHTFHSIFFILNSQFSILNSIFLSPSRHISDTISNTRAVMLLLVRMMFLMRHIWRILEMNNLRDYLNSMPAGKITDICTVEHLLAQCWDQFKGCDEGGMAEYKLLGRTENMEWDPPILSFTIERHGWTKFGSSRAQLQHWEIDTETNFAYFTQGIRQLYAREPVLKTKPLAEKIGKLILEKKDCDELKWVIDKSLVRVIAGKVLPNNVSKQTLSGRRKRFRKDLAEFLKPYGWQEVYPNKYSFISIQQ